MQIITRAKVTRMIRKTANKVRSQLKFRWQVYIESHKKNDYLKKL